MFYLAFPLFADGFDKVTLHVKYLHSVVLSVTHSQITVTHVYSHTTRFVKLTLLISWLTCKRSRDQT